VFFYFCEEIRFDAGKAEICVNKDEGIPNDGKVIFKWPQSQKSRGNFGRKWYYFDQILVEQRMSFHSKNHTIFQKKKQLTIIRTKF
jgi:hypothetical protein